jgi:hypothetical protein
MVGEGRGGGGGGDCPEIIIDGSPVRAVKIYCRRVPLVALVVVATLTKINAP